MASNRNNGLPIYRDDRSFADSRGSMFDDLRRHMDDDWSSDAFPRSRFTSRDPFSRTFGSSNLGHEMDRLCEDFFKLKPRNPRLGTVRMEDSGSQDSLDDDKMFSESASGSDRKFHVSFDVREYDPQNITVKVERNAILVEAKQEVEKDGVKSAKQFSRTINIPSDVDPDKLSSSLSNDGILTIEAPVPPKYSTVAYVPPQPQITVHTSGHKQPYIKVQSVPLTSSYQPQPMSTYAENRYSKPQYEPSTVMSSCPAGAYAPTQTDKPAPTFTSYSQQSHPAYQPPSYPTSPPQPSYPQSPPAQPPYQQPPLYPQPPVQQPQYPAPQPAYPQATPPQPSYPAPPPPLPGAKNSQTNDPKPAPPAESTPSIPLDTPIFSDSDNGRRLDLVVELGKPYTPEDILVKLEGRQLQVEAEHIEKVGGKKSKSSVSREFDLEEDIDPRTVQANFDESGRLLIVGTVVKEDASATKEEPTTEL